MAVRHGRHTALVPRGAPVKPRHPRVEASLVDEDQPCALPLRLGLAPPPPRGLDVRPCLLGGVRGFFYNSGPADRAGATVRSGRFAHRVPFCSAAATPPRSDPPARRS